MALTQILGTDYVRDALKVKTNASFVQVDTNQAEVEEARDGETDLLAKEDAQDLAIAALTAGSGVAISASDQVVGFVDAKLLPGNEMVFTKNNPGATESMTFDINYEAMMEIGFMMGEF